MFGRLKKRNLKKQRGMALFLVMISLTIITIVVADLSYNETIRYKAALNGRDALQAEALAEGALNLARLFLVVQEKIQPYITTFASFGATLPAYTIWELMPLDTAMFQSIVSGDLASSFGVDVEEAIEKRKEKKEESGEAEEIAKTKKEADQSDEEFVRPVGDFIPPTGGFGAFDAFNGSFQIVIEDEESKISLRNWASSKDPKKREATQKLLSALISPRRYDSLFEGADSSSRQDLLANIFDYIDLDEQRVDAMGSAKDWGKASTAASERDVYVDAKGVLPKNAFFDSPDELRLVQGMTDDHMSAFSDALTIYGEEGKVNILSAKDHVVETLVTYCAKDKHDPLILNNIFVDETVKGWKDYKAQGLGPVSVSGFMGYLAGRDIKLDAQACKSALDVNSKNFKLISSATVNGVTRTLTLVTRVVNGGEENYYFRNN